MVAYRYWLVMVVAGLLATKGYGASPPWAFDPTEVNPGGAATTAVWTARAFSQFAPTLDFIQQGHFKRGDHLFRGAHAGLGPLFNARSCQGCHVHDGRGHPPLAADETMVSTFLRLSIPGTGRYGGPLPEPTYGDQLQTLGMAGPQAGEGHSYIDYETVTGHYPDGTPYQLRRPVYKIKGLRYGPLAAGVMLSPRTAPAMFGLGLVEAIPAQAILAAADPHDSDGDGISGRPNWVWDSVAGKTALGRFGHKAGNPSLLQQLAGAFRGDIGVTNPLYPDDLCTAQQRDCAASTGPDASALELALVEFYSRTLAVPRRREATHPEVLAGKKAFYQAGCVQCHWPRYQTATPPPSALGEIQGLFLNPEARPEPIAALQDQTIWPYSDFLLHDMGGECQGVELDPDSGTYSQRCSGLADGRPEFLASASEWKTPPLWGIGLTQQVNPRAGFLHDGRARTLEEAILWHGGEAAAAKGRFMALDKRERAALLRFLESL